MRVACIQMRSGLDLAENLSTLALMVEDAASQGAVYIQTPEMTSLVAQDPKYLLANAEFDAIDNGNNKFIAMAGDLAKRLGIWLHLGSVAVRTSQDKAANRAVVFSPDGQRLAQYDKLHMFDVDLPNNESWRESKLYDRGDKAVVVDTKEFRLGLSICYDLRFGHLYRALAMAGAQILTCPAAFTKQTGQAHWHVLLRARAIENGAFVVAAAQGGTHASGRQTFGHSLIINPWGAIIAELEHDKPAVLIGDIDLAEVESARTQMPVLKNNTEFALTTVIAEH